MTVIPQIQKIRSHVEVEAVDHCVNTRRAVTLRRRLTAELLHEAGVAVGVEGQRVWRYAQRVEEVGGSDALQRQDALCTHSPHLLLGQAAVP